MLAFNSLVSPLSSSSSSFSLLSHPSSSFSTTTPLPPIPHEEEDNHQEEHFSPSASHWLQTGNCPLAQSARAIIRFLPLAMVAFQSSSISKLKLRCPPVVVAARAAMGRTPAVKALRLRPVPARVLAVMALGFALNVPLGMWKAMYTQKFSVAWFLAVHASVPFIAMLRKAVQLPKSGIAFTLAASILGQIVGSRAASSVLLRSAFMAI